jgi:hypothetical protein
MPASRPNRAARRAAPPSPAPRSPFRDGEPAPYRLRRGSGPCAAAEPAAVRAACTGSSPSLNRRCSGREIPCG